MADLKVAQKVCKWYQFVCNKTIFYHFLSLILYTCEKKESIWCRK